MTIRPETRRSGRGSITVRLTHRVPEFAAADRCAPWSSQQKVTKIAKVFSLHVPCDLLFNQREKRAGAFIDQQQAAKCVCQLFFSDGLRCFSAGGGVIESMNERPLRTFARRYEE